MVNAQLPDGTFADHPFVVISCSVAHGRENFYTGVMMTGSAKTDRFSWPIDNTMFEAALEKSNCHIRLYILSSFIEPAVKKYMNRMKRKPFEYLMQEIKDFTLAIDNN